MNAIAQNLANLIEFGWKLEDIVKYYSWNRRTTAFLNQVNIEAAAAFKKLDSLDDWKAARDAQIGMLEGYLARLESQTEQTIATANVKSNSSPALHPKRLFIVHGHDNEAKESVARFAERLKLEPTILHEQPNAGRTIIEKFEVFADVGFAVVLLTPDDVGAPANKADELKGRARQNVILELGYFLGKLTRRRVCALYKAGVEIPSDFAGVLFVEMDSTGAWRTKLAQELVEAGFSIDLQALIKS